MSKLRRVANVILSLLMILAGVELLFDPENALIVVAACLGLALVVYGVHLLVYYISMARHMTGGLSILFIAVIAIDLGSFSLALIGDPRLSVVLFLVCINVYTGILSIARAVESKLFDSPWKGNIVQGVVNIALAVACIVFIGSDQLLIALCSIWLFYNAGSRLVSVFKPTEIIYIQ